MIKTDPFFETAVTGGTLCGVPITLVITGATTTGAVTVKLNVTDVNPVESARTVTAPNVAPSVTCAVATPSTPLVTFGFGIVAPPPGTLTGVAGPTDQGTNQFVPPTGDVNVGKDVFRFETFGNEGFWTDAVRMPQGLKAAL